MRAIKLIKHAERKVPDTRSMIKAATRQDRLSQGIRSWVVEFKKTRRGESLIAFDSLFKDALLPSGTDYPPISQTCEEDRPWTTWAGARCISVKPLSIHASSKRPTPIPQSLSATDRALLGDSIFVCEIAHRRCSLKGSLCET